MIIRSVQAVNPVAPEGTQGVIMRVAIGKPEGAPNFVLRHFTLESGGFTPRHNHPWEHEIYVIRGRGEAWSPDGAKPLGAGDTIFVAPGEEHQFRNKGPDPFEFLCIIPHLD